MTEPAGTRQITLTSVFDAPREEVFAYWTDADHLKAWWGPDGMDAPVVTSDPRPGGELTIEMVGHGMSQTMHAVYREVVPPERLVVDARVPGPDGEPMLRSSHTVTFVDLGDRTEVIVEARAEVFRPEGLAALEGMGAGWNQSLQCLDDALTGAVDRQILLMRAYSSPPEVVFPLWVTREHLEAWWGPDGFSVEIDELDTHPGGRWRFTMRGPDGTGYPNHVTYVEVTPSARLVFTHGGPGDPGPHFTTVVTFDEFGGRTALSLRHVFASAEDRDLVEERYHAVDGGNQTLARLVDLLDDLA